MSPYKGIKVAVSLLQLALEEELPITRTERLRGRSALTDVSPYNGIKVAVS